MAKKRLRGPNDVPPGPVSLFRNKVRKPVTVTLTKEHHKKTAAAMKRLGLTRSDVFGLLLENHGDDLALTAEQMFVFGRSANE